MKNKLYQVNNFILVEKLNKGFNLPPHLAGNKDNIEKVGIYKLVDENSLHCLDFLNYPTEEHGDKGYYILYVDNYSVITVNKFNKEKILVPNSAVILVEFVYEDED